MFHYFNYLANLVNYFNCFDKYLVFSHSFYFSFILDHHLGLENGLNSFKNCLNCESDGTIIISINVYLNCTSVYHIV